MPAALVLAGSRPGPPDALAQAEGAAHKALIQVGGSTMLERVVTALRESGVERIAVSADEPHVVALARRLGCEVLEPANGPSASAGEAFRRIGVPLIVTTADHALLRPEWIRDLVAQTAGDVALLMARHEAVEAAVPGTKRTWLRFADGAWSGCNLFLLRTPRARAAIEIWSMVETNRKRPWRIAARLGSMTLASYLLGRLTLAVAVARLGDRIGLTAQVVSARDGRAAIDVDKVEDLKLVRRLIDQG